MASNKLDETRSFIDLYTHSFGESEVPNSYIIWCAISLIAAAVADRVWVTKFGKLPPNLYVALLGPSANGKDTAIDGMMDLAMQHPKIGAINFRSTAPNLLHYMTKSRKDDHGVMHPNGRLYLVMPEVSMSLRKGDISDDFVKVMTALYSGKPYPLTDGTVTRGDTVLRDYTLNWIFGSVLVWLLDVIPATSISGGTFGRIIGVHHDYQRDKRVEMPSRPLDVREVTDHLHRRLDELTEIEGEFTLTPSAKSVMSRWYNERTWPEDDSLVPAWKRQHDLVLKLSMILSLSDGVDLMIRDSHVWQAQKLSESVIRRLADIQAAAATSRNTDGIVFVRQYLGGVKRPVGRTELLKKFIARGFGGAPELSLVMQTLNESGESIERGLGRAKIYSFMGRRKMPLVTMPKPEEDE